MSKKICVLGTGTVGQSLSLKLQSLGYSVKMGTRDPQSTMAKKEKDNWGNPQVGLWLEEHPEIHLATFQEALNHTDEIVVFAMNGKAALDVLSSLDARQLSNKTMLDISNPLDFSNGFPPSLTICNTNSLSEEIQRAYPTLNVVKSLNTMTHNVMVQPSLVEGHHHVFVSGNNDVAKQTIQTLLEEFGWKSDQIIDLGDLTTARGTEMLLPLWVRLYSKFQNPIFNFGILRSNI